MKTPPKFMDENDPWCAHCFHPKSFHDPMCEADTSFDDLVMCHCTQYITDDQKYGATK